MVDLCSRRELDGGLGLTEAALLGKCQDLDWLRKLVLGLLEPLTARDLLIPKSVPLCCFLKIRATTVLLFPTL